MKKYNIKKITYTSMMMALVFVATAIVPHIPTPRGYVNLGDGIIFIASILFGWQVGAIVGGIGSALADIFLGYSQWALPTLIIKGLMGAVVGIMANIKTKKTGFYITGTFGLAWILLNVYLYRLLSNINYADTDLIQALDMGNPQMLKLFTENIKSIVLFTAILIPIIIFALSEVLRRKDKYLYSVHTLIGLILGGLIMISGYYFAEVILYGNKIVPIFGIPLSFVQFGMGYIIACIVIIPLKKAKVDKPFDRF